MEGVWRAVVGGGSGWEFGREEGGVEVEVDAAWCEEEEVLAKLECAEGVEVLAKPGVCGGWAGCAGAVGGVSDVFLK